MKNLKKLPKVKLPIKTPALPPVAKALMKKAAKLDIDLDDIQEGISNVTDVVSTVTEGITAFNDGVQAVSDIMQPSHLSGESKCVKNVGSYNSCMELNGKEANED